MQTAAYAFRWNALSLSLHVCGCVFSPNRGYIAAKGSRCWCGLSQEGVAKVVALPLFDHLGGALEDIGLEARGGRLEDVTKGLQVVLHREVSVEDVASLELGVAWSRVVNAMSDGVIAINGDNEYV